MINFLACPVCQQILARTSEKSYMCENRHSFDIAKQGYVNLLLATQGLKELGDSREMFGHRRQFLDKGFYNPIADKVNTRVLGEIGQARQEELNILDAGCGEGFYTKRLKDFLSQSLKPTRLNILGIDISKFGVQYAARRDPAIVFAVASVADLPVVSDSLDYIVSFFSPVNYEEFNRILKAGGQLLTVKAGPHHLYQLRRQIYANQIAPLQDRASSKYSERFTLIQSDEIGFELQLEDAADLLNLAQMTPYGWHLDEESKTRLETALPIQIQVEASFKVYQKL